jgi:hypothetical protein
MKLLRGKESEMAEGLIWPLAKSMTPLNYNSYSMRAGSVVMPVLGLLK